MNATSNGTGPSTDNSEPADEAKAAPRPLNAKELFQRYHGGVIPVFTVDMLGDHHLGSAFHVGDGSFVTARHVAEGQAVCRVALSGSRTDRIGADENAGKLVDVTIFGHPDPSKDVGVFSVPVLAHLPAIPLGSHLDDWLGENDFILNDVLVLGYPPIPLSTRPVIVAARGEVNAMVDLINVEHPHYIVSVVPRGGFSGGVVLSEWDFALGVITSSLVKNGVPEEMGYLTVLTVEPILHCLAAHHLLPRDLALLWDGTFTAETEYFGVPEKRWAHSWIETDRDGHRTRLLLATPDQAVVDAALKAIGAMPDIDADYEITGVDVHTWSLAGGYAGLAAPLERCRDIVRALILARGHLPVVHPTLVARSLEGLPDLTSLLDVAPDKISSGDSYSAASATPPRKPS